MTPADRKSLRARAHKLDPILQLGERGLTEAVISEIDRALGAHELIKVRAAPLKRDEREVALASICERTGAEPVQHIGKVFVLYRQKPAPARSTSAAGCSAQGAGSKAHGRASRARARYS